MFNLIEADDYSLMAPHGCMICGSAKRPILDLMQEFSAQELRLYLCKTHAREIVRAFGWVKGERLDKLEQAAAAITQVEKDRDHAIDTAQKLADELTRLQQKLVVVEGERDGLRDKQTNLLFAAQQVASSANALVIAGNGDG